MRKGRQVGFLERSIGSGRGVMVRDYVRDVPALLFMIVAKIYSKGTIAIVKSALEIARQLGQRNNHITEGKPPHHSIRSRNIQNMRKSS